tara:strand:- start:1845 stop:3647 length:1803 start_codon:yes stop_codon:yes gene_type:complete
MYIEEVLYHIDEDYRKWCDTVDLVFEELLIEDTKKKDAWFFDMSPEKQQAYIKAHPDSEKTKQLKKAIADKPQSDEPEPEDKEADDYADGVGDGAEAEQEPEVDETLPDTVKDLKQHVQSVVDAVGADLETIQIAFKQPSVYNTVKAIGGSISASSRIVMGTLRTVGKSLTVGGAAIHDTKAFQKLERGIIKTDEFMQSNPALSKLSAVAVSGLAIGQWLRMSFSGDIESDFDLTIIPQAFAGEAGFRELIATPDGIKGMGLLSVGMATGGLPIWMGGATGLALALTYSGLQSAGETKAGKVMKERMVKWAESMGQSIEKGTKAVDKKLGIQNEMFIESVQKLDSLKSQFDAKKVKKKELGKFFDIKCLEELDMKDPPANTSKETRAELEQMSKQIKNLSDAKKKEYIDTDHDTAYYIKEYMEDNDLEFSERFIEVLIKSARNVGRHFKNKYMRPRPYVVAKKLGMPIKFLDTETAHSPAYPSNHALQAKVVANYYSKIYPAHQDQLFEMADKSGEGRVNAGIHYPSDKIAGYKVADDMMEYILDWDAHNNILDEDAPVNATGAAVSTDTPLVRSRNRYKDKNKKEAEKLYTRILKRYDY